jgi:hypothetical protein
LPTFSRRRVIVIGATLPDRADRLRARALSALAAAFLAGAARARGDSVSFPLFPEGSAIFELASTESGRAGPERYRFEMSESARAAFSGDSAPAVAAVDPAACEFLLGLRFPSRALLSVPGPELAGQPEPLKKPSLVLGVLVAAGSLGGSANNSWKGGRFSNFHFTDEGFFGRDTYTGGVDKASHFVDYNVAARVIGFAYEEIGYSERRSQALGSGVAFLSGLVTEIGDGTTNYGFSYEDLLMDSLGAATAFGLAATGWDDTIGFRLGRFTPDKTPACCYTDANYGRDYSGEMYMGDLKIAGLARRLDLRPGIARYLLLSLNYSTNGYRYATADIRQRLLGVELGINFSAIAEALGVPEKKFWGRMIYLFFDTVRLPYTGIGFRYDLNHKKWYGPTAGRTPFDPAEAGAP